MQSQEKAQAQQEKKEPQLESFKYQLELLKMEIQITDNLIARMDGMAQTTKNWAIITWAGSIAIALGQPDLRRYIILSAILPVLFWYIDAYFRRLQRRSIFRVQKIREFLNSEQLAQSFEKQKLVDFKVYDPTGSQYKSDDEYKKFASTLRTFRFREIIVFYIALILISTGLGIFFLFI